MSFKLTANFVKFNANFLINNLWLSVCLADAYENTYIISLCFYFNSNMNVKDEYCY